MIIENPYSGVYNIGRDDDPRSMLEIAQRACQLSNVSEDLIQLVPAPAMQTVIKRLSTDRIRSLGWEPTVELEEGIKIVYEWIKKFDINSVEHP
jgi:nucleoside-diphosphate-sugar epimerase